MSESKSSSSGRVLFVLMIVGFVFVQACLAVVRGGDSNNAADSRARATAQPSTLSVEYRVFGSAKGADLTYENAGGNTEQQEVPLYVEPWSYSFRAAPGQFLYVSAQNTGERGTIGCQIRINGVVAEEARSEGAYKIATCSGSAGD